MVTLTNLNDVKRSLAIATNSNGTLSFDKNLDDALIADLILQATDMWIEETGVNYFGTQGTLTLDVTDTYVSHQKLFFREDMQSITRIENDGNGTLLATDWVTMPRSGDWISGVELKTKFWRWTSSRLAAIRVIGVTGRSVAGQPPEQVHLAVTRLASWLYQTRDTRGSVQFGDRITTFPSNVPDFVQRIALKEKNARLYV